MGLIGLIISTDSRPRTASDPWGRGLSAPSLRRAVPGTRGGAAPFVEGNAGNPRTDGRG